MKKFYLMTLAALTLGASASAASLSGNFELQSKIDIRKGAKVAAAAEIKAQPAKKVSALRKADAGTTSIEGTWTVVLGDYYMETGQGTEIAVDFEASVENGLVWFEDPTNDYLPFVCSLDETTNVLTFTRYFLGATSQYYVYQQPFVYNWDNGGLDFQDIAGEYIPEKGQIEFPEDNGIYWDACTDEDGNNSVGYYAIFDIIGASKAATWVKLEDGSFLENIIYSAFTQRENKTTADVAVSQNESDPAIIKVANPFGVLFAALGFNASSPNMTLDISDPSNVLMELQPTGINGGQEDGPYYIFNEGWYCEEYGGVLDPALACTMTVDDDNMATITFPYHSTTLYASYSEKMYYGSQYVSILKFRLPEEGDNSGVVGVETAKGDVRYFNLQGVEVKNPSNGAIVIRVEGDKAVKTVIR